MIDTLKELKTHIQMLEGMVGHPDLAAKFRHDILEIGGSKDIAEAFETFRGRPPSNHALLVQSGIESSNQNP